MTFCRPLAKKFHLNMGELSTKSDSLWGLTGKKTARK